MTTEWTTTPGGTTFWRIFQLDRNGIVIPARLRVGGFWRGTEYRGPTFREAADAVTFIKEHGDPDVSYTVAPADHW